MGASGWRVARAQVTTARRSGSAMASGCPEAMAAAEVGSPSACSVVVWTSTQYGQVLVADTAAANHARQGAPLRGERLLFDLSEMAMLPCSAMSSFLPPGRNSHQAGGGGNLSRGFVVPEKAQRALIPGGAELPWRSCRRPIREEIGL